MVVCDDLIVGHQIAIQAVKKRAFLNQVTAGAVATQARLADALLAVQTQINSPTFAKGRIVVSQSGSGQSGSFQIGLPGVEWTQDNIFGLTQELIELCAFTRADQSLADDGSETATRALAAAMMADDLLQGVREQRGDYTGIRFPVTR